MLLTVCIHGASAQMPQRESNVVSVTGWADDSHYILRTLDKDKIPVYKSVDIKSGKEVVYTQPKSGREQLIESLPSGISISANDIVSPDNNSAIFIKDNDLNFFCKRGSFNDPTNE